MRYKLFFVNDYVTQLRTKHEIAAQFLLMRSACIKRVLLKVFISFPLKKLLLLFTKLL